MFQKNKIYTHFNFKDVVIYIENSVYNKNIYKLNIDWLNNKSFYTLASDVIEVKIEDIQYWSEV